MQAVAAEYEAAWAVLAAEQMLVAAAEQQQH
jgi:hypothetical protein